MCVIRGSKAKRTLYCSLIFGKLQVIVQKIAVVKENIKHIIKSIYGD